MTPDASCFLPNASESVPAKMVPAMMAEKVPKPNIPLPQDNFFSGSSSGSRPYLDGPKNALCVLIKKTLASISGMAFSHRPSSATDMMPISAHLMVTVTSRLLKRSAKNPPAMENRMNGSAKSAPTSGTSSLRRASDDTTPTMRKVTSQRSRLSLKAFWNSMTNISQKLRSRDPEMDSFACFMSRIRDKATKRADDSGN